MCSVWVLLQWITVDIISFYIHTDQMKKKISNWLLNVKVKNVCSLIYNKTEAAIVDINSLNWGKT